MEFEPSYSSGGGLGVNWADVSYFASPGLIIRAGYFVLPFGIYSKRLGRRLDQQTCNRSSDSRYSDCKLIMELK